MNTLSPAESQKVETLLSQLAGTVIYSTENQLEPARVVKPGETLETIAKEYNVPWQLLAKINGIPAPIRCDLANNSKSSAARSPPSSILHRKEMTLEVDGRYAGTFPVTVPPGANRRRRPMARRSKAGRASNALLLLRSRASRHNDRTIVLRNAASCRARPPAARCS